MIAISDRSEKTSFRKRSIFEPRPEIDPTVTFHYIFCISVFCVERDLYLSKDLKQIQLYHSTIYFAFQSSAFFSFLKVLIKIYNYIFASFCQFLPLDCKVNGNRIIFVLFTIILPVYNTVLMQKLLIYIYSINK